MSMNERMDVEISGLCQHAAGEDYNDTNHSRGYVVCVTAIKHFGCDKSYRHYSEERIFPTARRDAVAPMSDEALDGFYHAPYYGECERGPFLKDSN